MNPKKRDRINPNDYIPKRFGLNYNPPQIIIEYLTPSTGKLYHHKIRLHKFSKEKNTSECLKEIYERHILYLDKNKVNSNQIKKLIEKLKANFKPQKRLEKVEAKKNILKKEEKKEEIVKDFTEEKDEKNDSKKEEDEYGGFDDIGDEDLNQLDDEEVKKKKEIMDVGFEKNRIKKEDSNFEYDVRKDFDNDQYEAEWDDDSY